MADQSSTTRTRSNLVIAILVLIGALLLFFTPSVVSPNKVLFANDGPLGANMAKAIKPPESMFGIWMDLNWVGFSGGTFVPNLTFFLLWSLGPVAFAKFYSPLCLLYLGLGAWLFFRQLRWHPIVCIVAALATMLNMNVFSNVCWGLGTRALCLGSIFFGLAAFEASKRHKWPWLFVILGGLAVGMAVTEGADNGAIYSVFLAGYVAYSTWQERGRTVRSAGKGVLAVVVIAIFAGLLAAESIGYLVPTSVKTVLRTQPTEQSKEASWDWATQWSLPKVETIRVLIPGIFGYRMDSPNGGQYWGSVGQQPGFDWQNPQGFPRQSGSGEYAGVIVLLIAAWSVAQSFRKKGTNLTDLERKMIKFWTFAAAVSLLLAYGRHSIFYRIVYALPYFSTIRNPIKFMHPFHLAVLILFSYGLEDLVRRLVGDRLKPALQTGDRLKPALQTGDRLKPGLQTMSMMDQLKAWWGKAAGFEKKWIFGMVAFFALSVLGFLFFSSIRPQMVSYLQTHGFAEGGQAQEIFRFASGEIGFYLLFLAGSIAIFILLQSGAFAGRRLKWAGVLVGLVLVIDLARANAPWVRYYDYKQKYASNPIIDILADKPYEHRAATQLTPMGQAYLANNDTFRGLMNEWMQHLFQYYNIHALDIIQMPRMPEFDRLYMEKIRPKANNDLTMVGRMWQLTNTRFVIGMTGYLQLLNQQVDPAGQAFRVHTTFDIVPKPGIMRPQTLDDITVATKPDGQMALFENTRALPRAVLFSRWQISTNDEGTLNQLASPAFDPSQLVLVDGKVGAQSSASPTNQAGTVEFTSYATREIKLRAKADAPSILMLNDKYDSDWRVYVDGAASPMLRCNYMMRGVALPGGEHQVRFHYEPPIKGLHTTLAALALALVLCVIVPFIPERPESEPVATPRPLAQTQTPTPASTRRG